MCNAVSTSEWQVLRKGITHRGDRSRVWRPKEAALESHRQCCDGDASSMQRVTGIKATYSDVHWIFHSRLSSVSYRLSYRYQQCVCVCVNFYFLAIPLFVICWVSCSVCIIGKSLIFLLSWKWMIFDLLKNTFCGFCLTTQITFSLWKGLESKRRARI